MRFVPQTNNVSSPRRRRPGLVGNGPFQPPVLARLPEIKSDSKEAEVASEDLSATQRDFRFDSAHAIAEQAHSPKSPAMGLVDSQPPATVSELPTMPAMPAIETAALSGGFAQRAAQILAETEQTTVEVAAPEPQHTSRATHRIDPGIAPPKGLNAVSENEAVAEKRQAVRAHSAPELTELDSPWHDWIVKLGGTFIAGLLLLMAYQSLKPKSNTEYSVDGQVESSLMAEDSLRITTAGEPGNLEMEGLASAAPVFIDPADVEPIEPMEPVLVAPQVQSQPLADASMEETDGPTSFDSLTQDLMPAPATIEPHTGASNADIGPITPVQTPRVASYPSTGYSPITRVKPETEATQPVQTLTPKPDYSLFPQPVAGASQLADPATTLLNPPMGSVTPAAPAAAKNPIWKPIAVDPNFPPAVQLNGTIQQYSR